MSYPTHTLREKIVVERTYKASPQTIWELWTTKDGFESWWGPEGFRSDVYELDAREGGLLHYDMVADTPEMVAAMAEMGSAPSHAVKSRFVEYQPFTRLVLRNVIDFIPGVAAYEADILVELKQVQENVQMVVTLGGNYSDDMDKMQLEGFTSQLKKLDGRFV